MFKQSRRRIVLSIMIMLAVVWIGTLSMIYISSFMEMAKQNKALLQAYTDMYKLPQKGDIQSPEASVPPPEPPFSQEKKFRFDPGFTDSPRFKLSIFYSVALTYDGNVIEIRNNSSAVHVDDELVRIAKEIQSKNQISGRNSNLSFYRADKNGYELVAFMDNTIVNENAMTLFRFTLIFGGAVLLVFYFLSVYLARRIVRPLEESYQKQKQFISDAGHELKTPISIVSANAELLEREVGENQWLMNIRYENERMGLLVSQLLNLARTENAVPQMEKIDYSYLVSREILSFEGIAYENGLSICSDIAGDIFVEGDSMQLKQLVSILIDNAIRHSTDKSAIRIKLSKEHGSALLSVRNKGNEISKEESEKIFERFYRLDQVRNEEDKHYGLGLAIAKAIITSHSGKIKVDCHDGFVEFVVKLSCVMK